MTEQSNWCFTSWGTTIKFNKWDLIEYMIYQKEECPTTKRIHWQGYVEFKKPYKLFQVKSLFKEKGLDLSTARESRERNILYCSKQKTFLGQRLIYSDNVINEIDEAVETDWAKFDKLFELP